MKQLSYIIIMLASYTALAQLYVSPNSYVYVKNQVVFVNHDINLQNNATIYLRKEAQILQGTSGTSTNVGQGKLSVFQEGTVNNFAYNYWCSPVGNPTNTVGNDDFGITMLQLPTTNATSIQATLTSTSYNGTSGSGSLTIASYWIWKYLSGANYSDWYQSGSNTNIKAGEGFTMKGTSGSDATNVGETAVNNPGSGQRYDFQGKPNDGNITVNVSANNFTLTGNPYPSALHVNAFLLDGANSACTGIAYYWEQNKAVNSHVLLTYQGGYGAYAPVSLASNGIYVPATYDTYNNDGTLNITGASSGLPIERKYAPIGQGFMVKGNSTGTLTLKNSYRSYAREGSFSQFEKASNTTSSSPNPEVETIPQIRLNTVINNQHTSQLALAFVPQATDAVDRGIDAKSAVEGDVPNEVYFVLDNNKYVIQGVNFDIDKRIKLGIKSTENASFKFDASTILNFDEAQPIYLYDDLDGSYHDIKNETYEVTLPTGIYNNRFEITFKNTALDVDNNWASNFVVFQNNTTHILTVSNPNLVEIQTVKLYDLNGKQLLDKQKLGAQASYEFAANFSEAVYLVEITDAHNRKMNKKIIIFSK